MGKSRRYIGSSDGPPILGVPSYGRTAIDVWERLTGIGEVEDEQNAMMTWGNILEPIVLEQYALERGVTLDRRRRRFYHPVYPFIGCTVDARAGDLIVEAKTSPYDRGYGEPGDGPEGLPLYVRVQVQHQMLVTGATMTHVPVLLRGYDLRTFEVPVDPEFQADYLEELVEWHETFVVGRTPPPVDDSESYEAFLKRRNPTTDGSVIEAPAGLRPAFRRWAEAMRDRKDAEHRIRAITNIVRDTMGDAALMTGTDVKVSYKAGTKVTVSWDLIAAAYRKQLEEFEAALGGLGEAGASLAALRTDLDAIVSLYTMVEHPRTLRATWSGALKELTTITPQDETEETTDAIHADANA